jgi:hypothetical protein
LEVTVSALSLDDQVAILRRHCMNLAGYALTLARRQGLAPEEALRLWMEPAMQRSGDRTIDTETWVARNAAAMAIFHQHVDVTQEEGSWMMRVDVGEDLPPLQAWDAVDYWAAWIIEQARVVAEPQGLTTWGRLDGSTLTIRFRRRGELAQADSFSAM